jgi:hypothetical protein
MRHVADFDPSPAGQLVRADPATHTALAFAVDPSQEWRLLQFTGGDEAHSRMNASCGMTVSLSRLGQFMEEWMRQTGCPY